MSANLHTAAAVVLLLGLAVAALTVAKVPLRASSATATVRAVLQLTAVGLLLTGGLRRVHYADGSEETPAVVLEVDNPENPGELALTGEDLGSLAEHLLALRGMLRE